MLGKSPSAAQNAQHRTPRQVNRLMFWLAAPLSTNVSGDPACGTAGFLVPAGGVRRQRHPNLLHDARLREHFHHHMFHGFDFDNTMPVSYTHLDVYKRQEHTVCMAELRDIETWLQQVLADVC